MRHQSSAFFAPGCRVDHIGARATCRVRPCGERSAELIARDQIAWKAQVWRTDWNSLGRLRLYLHRSRDGWCTSITPLNNTMTGGSTAGKSGTPWSRRIATMERDGEVRGSRLATSTVGKPVTSSDRRSVSPVFSVLVGREHAERSTNRRAGAGGEPGEAARRDAHGGRGRRDCGATGGACRPRGAHVGSRQIRPLSRPLCGGRPTRTVCRQYWDGGPPSWFRIHAPLPLFRWGRRRPGRACGPGGSAWWLIAATPSPRPVRPSWPVGWRRCHRKVPTIAREPGPAASRCTGAWGSWRHDSRRDKRAYGEPGVETAARSQLEDAPEPLRTGSRRRTRYVGATAARAGRREPRARQHVAVGVPSLPAATSPGDETAPARASGHAR